LILTITNGQKLAKFGSLTLKYDFFTMKMTSNGVEKWKWHCRKLHHQELLFRSRDCFSSPSRSHL